MRAILYPNGRYHEYKDLWLCWAIENLDSMDDNGWGIGSRKECKELECDGPHAEIAEGQVANYRGSD